VLQQDPVSGVDVIVAGRFTTSVHDLLSSGRLAELMQQVRDSYDLILIDSPPVLSLSDAGLIADAVDGTVFVTRWGRTRKETARYAVKQIQASGGSIVGLVLSFVNVKRASGYTYGDSGQYYGKHQKYYVS
jgi:polysaccharide biosynthesis transport protein